VTNLVNSTQHAFLSTMYVRTMYLWKLLENQRVTWLCVKWFHHTTLSLEPHATRFTKQSWLILNPHSTSLSTCLWLTTLGFWLFHAHMPLHYQIWSCLDYTKYTDRVTVLGYLLHFFKYLKPSTSHVIMYIFLQEFLIVKAKQYYCLCRLQLVEMKCTTQFPSENLIHSSWYPLSLLIFRPMRNIFGTEILADITGSRCFLQKRRKHI
jgi:hypothetical protein